MADDHATALVPLGREDDAAAELLDLPQGTRDVFDADVEHRVRREARAAADAAGDRPAPGTGSMNE